MSKKEEELSYKIGYAVGDVISFFLFGIFRLLFTGLITAPKRSKSVFYIYLLLIILAIVSYFLYGNCYFVCLLALLVIILSAIDVYVKDYPLKKKRKIFKQIFEELKIVSSGGDYPYLIYEEDTEYINVFAFKTIVPLEVWHNKQSLLESYLNSKILMIRHYNNDNNEVDLLIEKQPLPESILWNDDYVLNKEYLSLGKDHFGVVEMDLNRNPHTFIAGETGSGKSNILKCLIYQCIVKDYEVKLIDFKRGVSFSAFSDVVTIYSDYERIQLLLKSLIQETNDRLDLLRNNRVEDIKDYNRLDGCYMRRIVVFIDELAELMRSSDKEANKAITNYLETLTRLSRAVGINLIMGLQRPDSTIINGQIKNNVSLRICGRFIDPEPSRIMLGNDCANKITNIKGRFILKDDTYREFQAFRINDELMFYIRHKMYQYSNDYQKSQEDEYDNNDKNENYEEETITNESKLDFNFDDIL